jgi:hypothetical protein
MCNVLFVFLVNALGSAKVYAVAVFDLAMDQAGRARRGQGGRWRTDEHGSEEISRLRRENCKLEEEREILSTAAARFVIAGASPKHGFVDLSLLRSDSEMLCAGGTGSRGVEPRAHGAAERVRDLV